MPGHFQYPSNNTMYSWPQNNLFSAKHKTSLVGLCFQEPRGQYKYRDGMNLPSLPRHICGCASPGPDRSAPETRSGTNETPNNKQVEKSNNLSLAWIAFHSRLQHFSFNSLNLGQSLGRTTQYSSEKQSKSDCQVIGRFHGAFLNQC